MEEKILAKAIWKGASPKIFVIMGIIFSVFALFIAIRDEMLGEYLLMIAISWAIIAGAWALLKKAFTWNWLLPRREYTDTSIAKTALTYL